MLTFFPDDTYHQLTASSERASIYDDKSLVHRMVILSEAAGLGGGLPAYIMRSLLSEGQVQYPTVDATPEGCRPRTIERAGPTGPIVTTTVSQLDKELETRLLSLSIDGDVVQARNIIVSTAVGPVNRSGDSSRWHELQVWLSAGDKRVVIPFAKVLAESVPPVDVRMRRDFKQVLTLIKAHALLHQGTRKSNKAGQIVATIDGDYAAGWKLVAEIIAEGVRTDHDPTIEETTQVFRNLTSKR